MKIFKITNNDYETKQVLGFDMEDALLKYKRYLYENVSPYHSVSEILSSITTCTYEGEYKEDEYIK